MNNPWDIAAQQLRAEFNHQLREQERATRAGLDNMAGGMRKALAEQRETQARQLSELATIAKSLQTVRTGQGIAGLGHVGPKSDQRYEGNITNRADSTRPGIIRIEDIPGRRVPFLYAVDIPIAADSVSTVQESFMVSQEGPFVAVRRWLAFESRYQFQVTDPDTAATATFNGRSYGRYRPPHSAGDMEDSQHNAIGLSTEWLLDAFNRSSVVAGTVLPSATPGMPSSMASFRTMEFDGRIELWNYGSSYPRQNTAVPSTMWTCGINSPADFAALDFFERGETVLFKVTPTHVNNPAAGNVSSSSVFPVTANAGTGWPFLAGQFDSHEGIATPDAVTLGDDAPIKQFNVIASDPVARLPNGILTLVLEGYRIIQPIGPVY